MKKWLREYGLIACLILVTMVGYVFFRQHQQDILASSLDVLRDRLVALIEDPASRNLVAARFEQFKERVLAQEVTPVEVENVAANVLNLSNSGMTLTSDQAALMLEFASDAPEVTFLPEPAPAADSVEPPPAPPPAPAVRSAAPLPRPPPVASADLAALGARLESVLAFDAEVQKAMRASPSPSAERPPPIRYRVERGLHVDVDADMAPAMRQRVVREAERLDRRRLEVVWKRNMATELAAQRERAQRELRSLAALKRRPPREVRVILRNLASLESLKHMEAKGYQPLLADSIKQEIKIHLEVALEALEKDLEEAMDANDGALEEQRDALEEFLEEVEESLEELEEELEEETEEEAESDEGERESTLSSS